MSIRAVDEWLSLFDDPILGNSALDRLANASYPIVDRRQLVLPAHCLTYGYFGLALLLAILD